LLHAPVLLALRGSHAGQTLGKRTTGVHVVRLDGIRIGLGRALLREIVGRSLLAVLPLYFAANMVTAGAHLREVRLLRGQHSTGPISALLLRSGRE
jgi:uncharacterized RDD family membrane protein YckC